MANPYTRRTDLAMEAREIWKESTGSVTEHKGVRAREYEREGFEVTRVEILDADGEKAIGKPKGTYVTLAIDALLRREQDAFSRSVTAMADELRAMLPTNGRASALVVGIGNAKITPDAVGPLTLSHIMVTRHMVERMPEYFSGYRQVAAVAPGVLGTTGVETGELVRGVVARVRPDWVIVVDALASRRMSRVCSTIQISDTGIVPGSGIGNSRAPLNQETLGVPVFAIGVPTVVDAATLALDLLEEAGQSGIDPQSLQGMGNAMIVTPREIDARVADIAKVIGYGVNMALHDELGVTDIDMFLS